MSLLKKKKNYVGIYISPRSFIEVVKFDSETNTVLQHGRIDLAYDSVTRQISNIADFETNLLNLYEELDIPFNLPAVLCLQTVFLGHNSLPMELDDSEIKAVIAEQLENNFIFRNNPPEICYESISTMQETNTVHLAYTAIQKQQLVDIEESLKRIGINIVAIDTSYTSLLRGFSVAGITTEDISEGLSWTVLLVNNNNVALISLIGNKLVDFSEIPVVIKSFESKEVYTVINSYCNEAITTQCPDHLIIISKSDDVSAEELYKTFNLNCKITFVEENIFTDENMEPVHVELETVGASFWNKSEIPLNFNFLNTGSSSNPVGTKIKIGSLTFYMTPKLLSNIFIGLIVFSLLLVASTWLICSAMVSSMEKKYEDLATQKAQLESVINAASVPTQVSTDEIISKTFEKNGKILQSYNAIGSVIPEKLWIETFTVVDDLNTCITGRAYSVEDIVSYYQNLTRSAQFQNLKITSIKVIGDDSPQGTDVSIVQNNQPNATSSTPENLPNIPNLPSMTSKKYYTFIFGSPINVISAISARQGAPAASTPPADPAAAPAPPGETK
jgi:hypothetical protein